MQTFSCDQGFDNENPYLNKNLLRDIQICQTLLRIFFVQSHNVTANRKINNLKDDNDASTLLWNEQNSSTLVLKNVSVSLFFNTENMQGSYKTQWAGQLQKSLWNNNK